jgi:putative ABC transport system substrate-binding protein
MGLDEVGGLLSYGTSLAQAAHRMAWHAGRVLDGVAATDLPIETLRRPNLAVDMRTARGLGLTIPPEVLCA